jgi:hypothetical protein
MFGRLRAVDPRDLNFPMRAMFAVPSARPYKYWNQSQWYGDQGATSQCVAYSCIHFLEDGPVTHKNVAPPVIAPDWLYGEAQKVDEWEGENYDGTSVRAGFKVLEREKYIKEYRWAAILGDIIECVLEKGPVVMGTNWYESMMKPDPLGVLSVEGDVAGGHAWLINGVNTKTRIFRMKNSWGRGWGDGGSGWISFNDVDRLLHEAGEACIATELRVIQ